MRLIDADRARETATIDLLVHHLDRQPTVDAVEVVRCKDCKHMIPQSHTRYCTVWHGANGMGDEGFCNYGERRCE